VVVRRPGPGSGSGDDVGRAFAAQAAIGEWARGLGVAVPTLHLSDAKGVIIGQPCLVSAYVDGRPNFGPIGLTDFTTQVAASLFALHAQAVDGEAATLIAPAPDPRLQYQSYESAQVEVIRQSMAALAAWAGWEDGPNRVLHGDFWPGNLLWRDGKLVAVIDWEEAALGDPLRDLAVTCLDLRFLFGPAGPDAVERAYAARAGGIDRRRLAYWQLWAGLRPLGQLERWATAYPPFGRPDVTPRTMHAAIEASLRQALAVLAK